MYLAREERAASKHWAAEARSKAERAEKALEMGTALADSLCEKARAVGSRARCCFLVTLCVINICFWSATLVPAPSPTLKMPQAALTAVEHALRERALGTMLRQQPKQTPPRCLQQGHVARKHEMLFVNVSEKASRERGP